MAVFSPDGKSILTGSEDQTARLWDGTTGTPLGRPMRHNAAVYLVAYSPDSKTIATSSLDRRALLWDAVTARPLARPLEDKLVYFRFLAFSPDSKTILGGTSISDLFTCWLWDAATGRPRSAKLRHTGLGCG